MSLFHPKHELNTRVSIIKVFSLGVLLALLVAIPQLMNFYDFNKKGDASSYIAMAEGQPKEVLLHHARRVLHPWVVGKLRFLVETDRAFIIIGTLSLLIFLWINLRYLYNSKNFSLIASAALIFLPYLYVLHYEIYIQSLFFIALSSIYWLLVMKKRYLLSLTLLFLLFLTRDDTIIIPLSFILIILLKKQQDLSKRNSYYFIAAIIIVAILGLSITTYLTRINTNLHNMPGILFSILRLPLHLMSNLTGIEHWIETYKNLPSFTHDPLIVFDVPSWFRHFTTMKQIGIYEWNPVKIIRNLLLILSAFGTGPTILFFFGKKKKFELIKGSLAINGMLLFGCILFAMAPSVGPPHIRYYINAWPAFFLVMPVFLKQIQNSNKSEYMKIMACYFLAAWLIVFSFQEIGIILALVLLLIEIVLHWYTWRRLLFVFDAAVLR